MLLHLASADIGQLTDLQLRPLMISLAFGALLK
jgi:hypothetical protein